MKKVLFAALLLVSIGAAAQIEIKEQKSDFMCLVTTNQHARLWQSPHGFIVYIGSNNQFEDKQIALTLGMNKDSAVVSLHQLEDLIYNNENGTEFTVQGNSCYISKLGRNGCLIFDTPQYAAGTYWLGVTEINKFLRYFEQ